MNELIRSDIGDLPTEGRSYFFSDGTWSMYELIDYVLQSIPPSEVFITSFSLSEDSVRHLLYLKEAGRITKLSGLFDPSVRKTKTPLLYFASHVFDKIRLHSNHTKIVLFKNSTKPLVLSGSANLGRNRRLETGLFDTDPGVFKFFEEKLLDIFSSAVDI